MYTIDTICDDILLYIFSFLHCEKNSYFCSSSPYPYLNMYFVQKSWYTLLKKKECIWSKIIFNDKIYCHCSFPYEYTFLTHFKTHCSWIKKHYRKNYNSTLNPSSYNKKYSESRVYSFHNYVYNDKHKMDTTKICDIFKNSHVNISHFCCNDTGFMFHLDYEESENNIIEDKT